MNAPQQVTYTTTKQTARAVRIWIEGAKLNSCGFTPGQGYDITLAYDSKRIDLTLCANGERTVTSSSRSGKMRPIIDLHSQQIAELFPAGTRCRILFTQGRITIQSHHEDDARLQREAVFMQHVEKGMLTSASMFTGGGISTEAIHSALHDAGIPSRCVWIAECEVKYSEAAQENCLSIDDDTVTLSGLVEEVEPLFYQKVDILSFSLPCAGHSTAGKAKHKRTPEEHSGTALFGVRDAIRVGNPAIVISENVVEARDSAMYMLLKCELIRLGYKLFEQVLDSQHTDSLEQRRRYWLVAISAGIAPEELVLPVATASGRILADILQQDTPESSWKDHAYLHAKAERDAAAGKGFARQLLTGAETRCGTIGRFYLKRRSTEPFIVRADGKERLLTPLEHAAVKSIPSQLIAGVSDTTAHEILGQSVDFLQPYNLVRHLVDVMGLRAENDGDYRHRQTG